MILIYTTLNNTEEARTIGMQILKSKLANCVNFWPITCIYNYNGEITDEAEVVMIIKTQTNKFDEIQNIIKENINYDNFIGELNVNKVNNEFEKWLLAATTK